MSVFNNFLQKKKKTSFLKEAKIFKWKGHDSDEE